MESFLPGIKYLEFAIADLLKIESEELLKPGITVNVFGTFTTICIEGLASVESEAKTTNNQTIYTTKLLFKAGEQKIYPWDLETILSNKNIVYRLTDVNNKQWLLGINEKPFPMVNVKSNIPSDVTSAKIKQYEVTYTNTFSLLEIA